MAKQYFMIGILLSVVLITQGCFPKVTLTATQLSEKYVKRNKDILELSLQSYNWPWGLLVPPVEWQFLELPSTTIDHVIVIAVASRDVTHEGETVTAKFPITLIVNRRTGDVLWTQPDPIGILTSAQYADMQPEPNPLFYAE